MKNEKLNMEEQLRIISNRISDFNWYSGDKEFESRLLKAFEHYKEHCDDVELTRGEFEVSFLIALSMVK